MVSFKKKIGQAHLLFTAVWDSSLPFQKLTGKITVLKLISKRVLFLDFVAFLWLWDKIGVPALVVHNLFRFTPKWSFGMVRLILPRFFYYKVWCSSFPKATPTSPPPIPVLRTVCWIRELLTLDYNTFCLFCCHWLRICSFWIRRIILLFRLFPLSSACNIIEFSFRVGWVWGCHFLSYKYHSQV